MSHKQQQESDRPQESQPVRVLQQDFKDVAGDTLGRIPEDLTEVTDNVVVLVQDEPDPEMLTGEDYGDFGTPTFPGLHDGVPLTGHDEGRSTVLPNHILVLRGPSKRWCASREELGEEITVTATHEVVHHFGIPDERLYELGQEQRREQRVNRPSGS